MQFLSDKQVATKNFNFEADKMVFFMSFPITYLEQNFITRNE